jgi:hypothetical protein
MAEIKNTFLKGKMNQDLDSRLLPNGEYREAFNLMISRSEGSTVGEFENMFGNTSIKTLNSDSARIIGNYVNETTNKVYLYATDWDSPDGIRSVGQEHFIYELDLSAPYNLVLLVTGNFLNFNQSFPITGVNLVQDLLFWTDNLNQPRKINITLANPSVPPLANPIHYTSEDNISVAKYAPCDPVIVLDRVIHKVAAVTTVLNTVITPVGITGIKIGDIVSQASTIVPPIATSPWNQYIYVVAIEPTGAVANSIVLSKSVTIPTVDFEIAFQRPGMTNKTEEFLPGGEQVSLSAAVTGTSPNQVYEFLLPATDYYADIIPKIGWLVSGPGTLITSNTTITSATASFAAATGTPGDDDYQQFIKWTVTLSKETTAWNIGQAIKIGLNPNFSINWTGDADFLEDKFIRFSYRFKYEDNEYSLMAPFSQPMFIPKQNSEFGGGSNSYQVDMDNAYKSTILNWFENSAENIGIKIPVIYSTPGKLIATLLVTEIDILYKESDALAVKVLDTIVTSSLSSSFSFIDFNDPIHGDINQYYYEYDYASSKPYKTLPASQTTRVYDKVPIKALAQELIGNRVVYGNYVDKHSSPASIDFSALISAKKPYRQNTIEYPFHNLKQNRTYQVGFVLSDRYGRQSDVVLSSYDSLDGTNGSTIFSPYNSYIDQIGNPIIDWLGDALSVRIDSAVATELNPATGMPGIWEATTNPLGWYSYKVVVKQQQQEYYNVYLPGFVNGLPITSNDEENKSSFSVLLSDNINKVPRDLNEVGPTDTEFSSSERLYLRVNNPTLNSKPTRPYGIPQAFKAWNKQYYPGLLAQEVLSIQTVRDMQISAVPFVIDAPEGVYDQVGTLTVNQTTTPVAIGSIPWGQSPKVQPFYNSDLNPFAIKIDTTSNSKLGLSSTEVPTVAGGIGAITNSLTQPSTYPVDTTEQISTMTPYLSVAETKPVYSLLEIFWETSLQGKINTLNSLINSQDPGITSITSTSASFSEDLAPEGTIDAAISFVSGGGTTISNPNELTNVSILSAFAASDINSTTDLSAYFTFTTAASAIYSLKTAAAKYFVFNQGSANNPSNDVYNITFQATYDPGQTGTSYTSTTNYTASLTNNAPSFTNATNPTGITIASTTIKTFAAINGTNTDNTAPNQIEQLLFDLSSANSSAILNQFTMSAAGILTTNSALIEGQTYSVIARVTDVNGNGISTAATITFTVGVQHTPKAICEGREGTLTASCAESFQASFLASSTTPNYSWPITVGGISFPEPTNDYNVRANYDGTATTGALTQGVMNIKPTLQSTLTPGGGSVTCKYTIQQRALGTTTWFQAVDTSNSVIGAIQLSASFGNPDVDTKAFSIVGEYRVISTDITGEGCSAAGGVASFFVDFEDATYPGTACIGPL